MFSEASLLGLQMAVFPLFHHIVLPLYLCPKFFFLYRHHTKIRTYFNDLIFLPS